MSINWVELNQYKQPLPIGQERFMHPHSGRLLEAKAKICSPIQREPHSEGNSSKDTELETAGVAYLSDMRLVFVSNSVHVPPPANSFSTFSALFTSIVSVNYVQPWFGGNYIEVAFKPTPEGGLPIGAIATVQLRTDGRGLYEFCAALQQAMEAARRKHVESTTLPVYTPSRNNVTAPTPRVGASSTASRHADPPSELPPAYSI